MNEGGAKPRDEGLRGRVAVVTGASRGIGRAIATTLARAGARVVGCRVRPLAEGTSMQVDGDGRQACRMLQCDVKSTHEVQRFAETVLSDYGPPDILVNNAGTVVRAALDGTSDEDWAGVIEANLTGTFKVTRAFLPAMRAAGRGRIINISSIAGRQGTAMLSAYCAAKHGVIGLTRALQEELRDTPLMATAICPGSVDTEMLQIGMPGGTPSMTPQDIADVVLFLAQDAPHAIKGAVVDVFG